MKQSLGCRLVASTAGHDHSSPPRFALDLIPIFAFSPSPSQPPPVLLNLNLPICRRAR